MEATSDDTALFEAALAQAESGQPLVALRLVRDALAASSVPDARLWGLLCLILSAQHQYKAGLSLAEPGLYSKPADQALMLHIRASLHQHIGETEVALQDLAQSQARNSQGSSGVWLELGRLFLDTGQLQDAAECISKSVVESGWTPATYCLQARLHQAQGQWQDGIDCCQNALAVDSSDAAAAYTLSQLLVGRKQRHNSVVARALLSDVMKQHPQHAEAWQKLAHIDKERGQHRSAAVCLQTFLNLQQTQPVLPYRFLRDTF